MAYCRMKVAVKEYFCRTVADDVIKEASTMAKISGHSHMPYFFGANTSVELYFLVMEFAGINDTCMSVSVAKELHENLLSVSLDNWICMLGQLIEAIDYLHSVADLGITNGGCKDFAHKAHSKKFLATPTSGR